jgi:GT2 family glycosyltransferase
MTVSVIVPNYNGLTILRKCLYSLLEHNRKPEQIVVVDNNSTDGSQEVIKREFPQITLVALKSNTGFTGANNAGMNASDGDLLVLLNNDCIVETDWLNNLYMRMDNPSIAAVTSSMRNINDVNTMDSAGGQINWMGFSRDIGKGEPASRFSESMPIPFPCGGAVMIRRSALPSQSRLFWNELFIYQEDLDLGFELQRTGWEIVYEPSAVVRHMHSATMSKTSYFKETLCVRNRILVLRKHLDPDTFRSATPIIKRWQNLWLLASLVKGRVTLAKAILRGTSDGFSMPVEHFKAPIPAKDVFVRFALPVTANGGVKRKMGQRMEQLIRQEQSIGAPLA